MQDVRKDLLKNLTKLLCLEVKFDNYKRAIILAKEEKNAESKIKKVNIQCLNTVMATARAVLAQQNPPKDLSTVTTASVSGN